MNKIASKIMMHWYIINQKTQAKIVCPQEIFEMILMVEIG
jgi:hypothetical protein